MDRMQLIRGAFTKSSKLVQSLSVALGAVLILWTVNLLSQDKLEQSRLEFDRQNLYQFFAEESYDNDLVLDTYYLSAQEEQENLINKHLLGLQRDRLAYLAKSGGEVVAIAVPATADDGFNGTVDLLIAVDMVGRISAARVIQDIDSDELYGIVDVIESQWMKEFTGNTMRDTERIALQTISPKNEYDQFVGASVTPKTVADRIYNALVFFQSNRIELMTGGH